MLFYDLGNEVLFKIIVVILFDKSSTYFMHEKTAFYCCSIHETSNSCFKEFQIDNASLDSF